MMLASRATTCRPLARQHRGGRIVLMLRGQGEAQPPIASTFRVPSASDGCQKGLLAVLVSTPSPDSRTRGHRS
jgi:hypothetical protein